MRWTHIRDGGGMKRRLPSDHPGPPSDLSLLENAIVVYSGTAQPGGVNRPATCERGIAAGIHLATGAADRTIPSRGASVSSSRDSVPSRPSRPPGGLQ